ncbi:hypothetical protein TURU_066283 [Turdus rufiventris]|nr:hypothetical protein TURU_066283 [Turdus rufiventris]
MLEERDASRGDLDRFERWTCEKLMIFNKAKCNILHLGWDNPKHKYSLAREWIETSPGEKDLGVFVDKKLNMNWQCMFAAQKANHILVCIKRDMTKKSKEVILLYYTPVTPHLNYCVPNTRRMWTC